MDPSENPHNILTLLAVRLVQPGMLGDIHQGVGRLNPNESSLPITKEQVHNDLENLIAWGLVARYAGRRYELTSEGTEFVKGSGIPEKIDGRRMYLLKETRGNTF